MTDFFPSRSHFAWGRVKRPLQKVAVPHFTDQLTPLAQGRGTDELLPVGLMRSYGDSCLNSEGNLIDMHRLDRVISFDRESGYLHATAGLSLDALLQIIVPHGWFLPTTPGTRFVTLGGAVANDVHGKNHHIAGSFGCAVKRIGLIRSDGTQQDLGPDDPLFAATIGGLGLTGIITDVSLQLVPVKSTWLEVESIPFIGVDTFFELADESASKFEHTVAWIDSTSTGRKLGRGIFQRANWAADGNLTPHSAGQKLKIPVDAPGWILNRFSVRAFNMLYHFAQTRGKRSLHQHYAPFFYPLDAISGWNRLYGRHGFYQYQCVLPPETARESTQALLEIIARSGAASFLTVLKTLGPHRSPGLLSFPYQGATLALDFKNRGQQTIELFERLDTIVREAGGRLYPAKDGRMPAEMFQTGYPAWQSFLKYKDPGLNSDFWRRVTET